MARKYRSIWIVLKNPDNNYTCAIAAPTPLHARFIKAVIKEKDADIGYKLTNEAKGIKAKLSYTVEGAKITFRLSFNYGCSHITVDDL